MEMYMRLMTRVRPAVPPATVPARAGVLIAGAAGAAEEVGLEASFVVVAKVVCECAEASLGVTR
jgi:hypothetical protein